MSFAFMFKQGSATKSQPLPVRKETVTAKASGRPSSSVKPARSNGSKSHPEFAGSASSAAAKPTKKRLKPSTPAVDFGSDESDEDEASQLKKAKLEKQVEFDDSRQVRSEEAFSASGDGHFSMIHAADIPLLDRSVKFVPIFGSSSTEAELELQYPSLSQRERYRLIKPQSDDDAFHAVRDMSQVMRHVVENYIPEADRHEFDNEISGYPQRLNRAVYKQSEPDLRKVVEDWNDAISKLLDDGIIARVLDQRHSIDSKLVERILSQAYTRTVSPRLQLLHRYEAGTDNVYGELLPKFISDILKKDLRVRSDQVFVDLGSGVGNVVLQAALEVGCESWGCEMMNDYCDVAELQQVEFDARCRLWGLAVGEIHLERGDFLSNAAIGKALQRADVVLVNNQVFTPTLNERLTSLFLDLKEGCRVVSLKSFVPAGHKISARNLNSPYNVLQVVQKEYFSNCVSWTSAGGSYFISTKDSSKIRSFAARNGAH